MMRGDLISINEARLNVMMNWIIPLLPRRTVLKTVGGMQTK